MKPSILESNIAEDFFASEIVAENINKGNFILLAIKRKYTNNAHEYGEDILIFGKRFNSDSDVEVFKNSKLFKNIFKIILKNLR